ncbi:lafT [Acrasis kona]|uniref:LafT n=1 Tax=Acrasis kona TaxID=1008807 RepID=A0AAW2Z5J2_9EUKA
MTISETRGCEGASIEVKVLAIEKRKALKSKDKLLDELERIKEERIYIENLIELEKQKNRDMLDTLDDARKKSIMLMYNLRKENHRHKSLKKDIYAAIKENKSPGSC